MSQNKHNSSLKHMQCKETRIHNMLMAVQFPSPGATDFRGRVNKNINCFSPSG